MVGQERRSPEAFDRFSKAVDGPMVVLSIAWLPVLVIPLLVKLNTTVSGAFSAIDYTIWAVFVVEYLVKLYLAPSRWHFIRTHILDLAVISVPFLRPVRALRFLRLLRAVTVAGEGLARAKHLLSEHGLHYVLLTVFS